MTPAGERHGADGGTRIATSAGMNTTARLVASLVLAAAVSSLAGCFWGHDRYVHDPPREGRHDDHHDGDHHDEHHE
jgi:hypothetical protein